MEQLSDDLFERTVEPVKDCLKDAGWSANEIDELVLVGGMTRMPKVVETARSLVSKEPHQGVNPDEVVAVGAAIQGGVLKGEVKDVLLLDVTPLSPRDRNARRRRHGDDRAQHHHSDAQVGDLLDRQRQPAGRGNPRAAGRAPARRDNKQLGKFHLDGIPPAPRGVPQIEVTFDIDANGILHVSAKDLGTGKEQKITITASSGLTKDEVEKMRETPKATRRKTARPRRRSSSATTPTTSCIAPRSCSRSSATNWMAQRKVRRRRGCQGARSPQGQRHRRRQERVRCASSEVPGGQFGALQGGGRAGRSAARTRTRGPSAEAEAGGEKKDADASTPSSSGGRRQEEELTENPLTTVAAPPTRRPGLTLKTNQHK